MIAAGRPPLLAFGVSTLVHAGIVVALVGIAPEAPPLVTVAVEMVFEDAPPQSPPEPAPAVVAAPPAERPPLNVVPSVSPVASTSTSPMPSTYVMLRNAS